MTPERMMATVLLWARVYTRRLPEEDARRRIDELRADLHDHVEHDRALGADDRRITGSIAGRMVRGMAADLSWRHERTRDPMTQEDHMPQFSLARRSATRIAVTTALVLLVPAVLMLVTNGTDWGVFDFVFAGAIVAAGGVLVELVVHSRGTAAYVAAGIAGVLGVAAMVAGETDDAPGLVGFGLLLILGTVALTVRNVQRAR